MNTIIECFKHRRKNEKEMEIETTKKEDIETSVKNLSLDDLMKELNSKID